MFANNVDGTQQDICHRCSLMDEMEMWWRRGCTPENDPRGKRPTSRHYFSWAHQVWEEVCTPPRCAVDAWKMLCNEMSEDLSTGGMVIHATYGDILGDPAYYPHLDTGETESCDYSDSPDYLMGSCEIEAIPRVQIDSPQTDLHCSVCLDCFRLGEVAKKLVCSHYFHVNCITPWLQNHCTRCPTCRCNLQDPPLWIRAIEYADGSASHSDEEEEGDNHSDFFELVD